MKVGISKTGSLIICGIIIILITTPVYAASIWMSVDPGYQAVRWDNPRASWITYTGKEVGCPETNLKNKVIYGDGWGELAYNVHACDPEGWIHTFPPAVQKTWYQKWYAGQGSGSWYYMVSTRVYEYQPH